jgi:hypothetical protein
MPGLLFKIQGVWPEDNSPRLTQNVPLVVIKLKLGLTPFIQRHY